MNTDVYRTIRDQVADAGYASDIEWAQTVGPPADAITLWCEYGWVVVNSGMRATVAQGIWERILQAVAGGSTASSCFGHTEKAAAIDSFWQAAEQRLAEFLALTDDAARLAWCHSLAWIGPITKYHLAKNLGVDCAKPDRWLTRTADAAGETPESLCRRLAAETGDRIATVDLVIWRACEQGIWRP